MTVLFLILTSSNFNLLIKCIESLEKQYYKTFKYEIKIMVNALNHNYYLNVKNRIKKYEVIRSVSNGYPGKGHNSLIQYFKENNTYDYLFLMDGDDLLYPSAFEQINKLIKKSPDIILSMMNDKIITTDTTNLHYPLKHGYKLITSFNEQEDYFKTESLNLIGNPFDTEIYKCTTPARIILLSRNIFNIKYTINYGEDLKLYDDYTAFLDVIQINKYTNLKVYSISDTNIYFYNTLNDNSASHIFKTHIEEDIIFRKYIEKYKNITFEDYKNINFIKNGNPSNFILSDKINFCNELIKEDFYKLLNIAKYNYEINMKVYNMGHKDYDLLIKLLQNKDISTDLYRKINLDILKVKPNFSVKKKIFNNFLKKKMFVDAKNIYVEIKDEYKSSEGDKLLEYTEKRDKPILCYYVGESAPFNGKNYQEKNVYGSEIASVKLCEEFVDEYEIFIFNNCIEEIKYNNIQYLNYLNLNRFLEFNKVEHFIISRFTHSFLLFNFNNVKNLHFLMHDSRCHESLFGKTLPKYGIPLFLNNIERINNIIFVSEWQKNNFLNILENLKYKNIIPESKMHIIPNGINIKYFKNINYEQKDKLRFIYHSDPSRGLMKLINILIKLKKIYDNVKLDIYFSHIADKNISLLIEKYDFITFHGKLSNDEVIAELKKTSFWIYPNINMHETFCIAALEAMAAGNIILGLNDYGSGELIKKSGNYVINKDADEEEYVKLVQKLINDNKSELIFKQKSSNTFALKYNWSSIANIWIDKIVN